MRVICHNIRSIHNIGSIFRTSDALGIEKIYLTGYSPTPVDRFSQPLAKFAKVSLGAEQNIPWESVHSPSGLIKNLRAKGFQVYGIEQAKNSIDYYKLRLNTRKLAKLVLVIGNEIRGLSPVLMKQLDKILEIPMLGGKESLNVSVAFGIVAAHLRFSAG